MRRTSAVLLALGVVIAPALAQEEEERFRIESERPSVQEQRGPRVPYEVDIRGVQDELRALIRSVSETLASIGRPPPTATALRRRAQADIPRFLQALRSRGYYDAAATVEVDATREPALVTFRIERGDVYRLRDIVIETIPPGDDGPFRPPRPAELGLEPGQPAAARPIIDAEAELLRSAQRQGFALARLGERTAAIERPVHAMDLTLRIEPGPRTPIGEITVTGLENVHERFVRRRLELRPGAPYDPEALAAARERLVESGLFASVLIRLGEELGPDGRLPITVEVTESKHRSIGVGVNYWTDVGLGGNVSWEHRNLRGRGERLRFEAEGSGLGSTVSSAFEITGSFRKPDFLTLDQAFIAEASLRQASTEAFESRSIGAQAGVERRLGPYAQGSLSLAFRTAQVGEAGEAEETFGLLSLPASLNRDTSDNLLDPTEGGRLRLDAAPFVDTFGSGVAFGKGIVRYSHYLQVRDEPRIVLAGRIGLGTLFGAERDEVPADERLYAGGGGSIRGYGFQLVSPLDDDDDPIGGRSLLELAGEVRGRITETIGGVVFLDAGNAYTSTLPDPGEGLRFGAGVGLRYFTPIGPLRLDVAVPLNRRDIDDAFQLYISFGQAF